MGSITLKPYHQEIFDLILLLLIGTQDNKTHYSSLCDMMKSHANSKLASIKYVHCPPFSHRDISATLDKMVKDNLLKKDHDKRRGMKVFYELTPDAKNSYQYRYSRQRPKIKKTIPIAVIFRMRDQYEAGIKVRTG